MWIQVRTIDGKKTVKIHNLSKLSIIGDVKKRLVEHFDAEPHRQRLFFRGKQLEDEYKLFDYDVGLNDLIQLMFWPQDVLTTSNVDDKQSLPLLLSQLDNKPVDEFASDKENKMPDSDAECDQNGGVNVCPDRDDCSIYKVGDIIDARDPVMGAWFEATILEVARDQIKHSSSTRISGTQHAFSNDTFMKVQCPLNLCSSVAGSSTDRCVTDAMDVDARKDDRCGKEKCDSAVLTNDVFDKHDANHQFVNLRSSSKELLLSNAMKVGADEKNLQKYDGSTKCLMLERDMSDELKKHGILSEVVISDGFAYRVMFDSYDETVDLSSKNIRPRARHLLPFENIEEGQSIMANYNYDDPPSRGFWYDCLVTRKTHTRALRELYATVYIGSNLSPLENCHLVFLSELFDIERPTTQLTEWDVRLDPNASPSKRKNKLDCEVCLDNPRRKCKHCACCICGGKHDPGRQLLCDECDRAYHLDCLDPPLSAVPDDDDWYCPSCKTDENAVVKAGEKPKESKKKAKMMSANSSSKRDWGKGMACVGRSKICTIVPSNHFGPIPGLEVGTMWMFRVQVSEAGVHRPHVAGIHGREKDGAFSIVLSGGYEDDTDNGVEFYYTGSGGRDLSKNKRTAEQSCDQKLSLMNRALAKNCNVTIDSQTGAEAVDWRAGKPVRVIRNYKAHKHSKFAPEEGNRYDGIYKVVRYWAEKGKSGFLVWRYLLRRDDPSPAPWTASGIRHIRQLGLEMLYPDGYLVTDVARYAGKRRSGDIPSQSGSEQALSKRGVKRKSEVLSDDMKINDKCKKIVFRLDADIIECIHRDIINKKLWDSLLEHVVDGKQSCIQRSFKAEVYSCPACRMELDDITPLHPNHNLMQVLGHFYPGYEVGRR